MLRNLALVIIFSWLVSSVRGGGISVSQSLNNSSIRFEDSVSFEIKLEWDGPQWAYRFDSPLNPHIDRLKVRGFSSSIKSMGSGEEEITTKVFKYTLIPTSAGLGRIEPVTISYVIWPDSLPGELVTEEMTVSIASPRPPAAAAASGNWVYLVIAAVVVGGTVVGFVFYRRFRNRRAVEPVRTPAQQFLEDLVAVRKESGNDMKAFQTGLHRILLAYLAAQYDFDAAGMSATEMSEALAGADLAEASKVKITEWLVRAERDKFRPVSAGPGETIRFEAELRELFERL